MMSSFEEWWKAYGGVEGKASRAIQDAFAAGWKAAKVDEGYHEYTKPMNALKSGCTTCQESFENGKHFEVRLESTSPGK